MYAAQLQGKLKEESIGNASNTQTHSLIHIQQTDIVK